MLLSGFLFLKHNQCNSGIKIKHICDLYILTNIIYELSLNLLNFVILKLNILVQLKIFVSFIITNYRIK